MTETIRVLCANPHPDDHARLREILHGLEWPNTNYRCQVWPVSTVPAAIQSLQRQRFPIIFAERNFQPGTWKELLGASERLADPPALIVTSRVADERLWTEVLKLGVFDILLKPFDYTEVIRVVGSAWVRWSKQRPAWRPGEQGPSLAAGPSRVLRQKQDGGWA